MMRSLFSGVAGLKTHQTKMDVIGNNIANVNTVAYKSQNVTFQELMYQTTQAASAANAETGRGGVNAKQIGLGVQTGAINANITTSGASQTTGNPFDVQIKGDSFFIVSDGSNNYFTRAGAFYVDGAGNLAMTSNGYTVMGWQEDPNKPGTIIKDTVKALKIMSPENMTSEPEQTTQAFLSGVIDKNSTQLSSTNGLIVNVSLYDNLGYSYIAKFSIKNYVTDAEGRSTPLEEGTYDFQPLDLVDSKGYSLMHSSSEKGYEKNGYEEGGYDDPTTITLSANTINYDPKNGQNLNVDANGNEVPFTIQVHKATYEKGYIHGNKVESSGIQYGDNPSSGPWYEYTGTDPADPASYTASTDTYPVKNKKYYSAQSADSEVTNINYGENPTQYGWYELVGSDTTVDSSYKLTTDTSPVPGKDYYYYKKPETPAGELAEAFQADISLMVGTSTMYDNKGTSTIKGNSGDYDGNWAGRKVGEMSGVAIATDGKITATYDNGTSKLLGQIAVANFANPSGLEKIGDNLYQSTPNSGAFDGIGEDITAGSGSLSTGVLEMSNVDLSAEFTDMITTQRGFQANSRIITVSDSMLEELTNLKR